MTSSNVIFEYLYKGIYTYKNGRIDGNEINVSVILYCEKNPNRFHLLVVYRDWFIGSSLNVWNWPVEEWTLEQMKECLRVFYEEYMVSCKKLAEFVNDAYFHSTNVFHVSDKRTKTYVDMPADLTDRTDRSDLAKFLLQELHSPTGNPSTEEWDGYDNTAWIFDEKFGTCESTVDIGWEEYLFPFDEMPDEEMEWYREELPTLMSLGDKARNK